MALGEVVLGCASLDETAAFFRDLGFRLSEILPADDPEAYVLQGFGLRLRLERGDDAGACLRLVRRSPDGAAAVEERRAPNGTRVLLVDEPDVLLPELRPSFAVTRARAAPWKVGRAGMHYRDLIPDRQGGRFVASHIRIPGGGPVPDYAHFHRVRFQLIFCRRGWVRVAYEDQGEPLLLRAGDAVLQPPRIRHRVLESSPGLEVVELGSPARHATLADHDLELPTARHAPERDFGGQRFVHHVAGAAPWGPWRLPGFEARAFGLAAATGGLGEARVVRPRGEPSPTDFRHGGELLFLYVLEGAVTLDARGEGVHPLAADDAAVIPRDLTHRLVDPSADLELLEVSLPAELA